MEEGKLDTIIKKRQEIIDFLKEKKINAYQWEMFIKNYIDERYKESTL